MTRVAEIRSPSRPDDLRTRAMRAMRTVFDPELALDVVAMGLIYDLRLDPAGTVEIDMTLTTPGCPVSELLPAEVQAAVAAALDAPVVVNLVWDPPWTPERLSDEAKQDLGFGG